jgi:hypothetical protein
LELLHWQPIDHEPQTPYLVPIEPALEAVA